MPLKQDSQFGLVSSLMRSKIMVFVKLLLQILLLLIFLQFFGLPAISKYHQKDVMIVESTKDTEGIPLPAISLMFAASAPEIQKYRSCYQLNVSIIDCLETNAPNVSTILKKTLFGYKKRKTLNLGKNNLTTDLGDNFAGLIYTINLPLKVGPNDMETQFFLFLAPTFLNVMLHDPNFFIYNDNPYGVPTATQVFDAGTQYSHYRRIAMSEMQELNLPSDPCNSDQEYNFNSCVRRSLARQVNNQYFKFRSQIFKGGLQNIMGQMEWARYS